MRPAQDKQQTWVNFEAQRFTQELAGITSHTREGKLRLAESLHNLDSRLAQIKEYQEWNSNVVHDVAITKNYRMVDVIGTAHTSAFLCPMKDGRVVEGSKQGDIHVWNRDKAVGWKTLLLPRSIRGLMGLSVNCEGEIVSLDRDGRISLFKEDQEGIWCPIPVIGLEGNNCFQTLPGGSLVSIRNDALLFWEKRGDRLVERDHVANIANDIKALQVLPGNKFLVWGRDSFLGLVEQEENGTFKLERNLFREMGVNYEWCRMFPNGEIAALNSQGKLSVYTRAGEPVPFNNNTRIRTNLAGTEAPWIEEVVNEQVHAAQCLADGRIIALDDEYKIRLWHRHSTPDFQTWVSTDLFALKVERLQSESLRSEFLKSCVFNATIDGRIFLAYEDSNIYIYDGDPK